ncbi:phosphonate ABC transporter, permease protein PhnE [Acidovorax sp. sic0104]|uniref:phosphonate ABC transporter, permease protein PhnE n=1 Tax=Acidovorax sp. sic0104 TaxID=2854784 RepID=UPI001C43A00D|nr:phosphonate ABC transporter, permease protein PhnE [Acidovorax sp. sic0104]MBV7539756.1 phosphonate ABC transporter, permease protein PhnE [Acidovorax sp. sic0104]
MNIGSYTFLVARPSGGLGWWPRIGIGALFVGVLWWAARGAQVSFGELAKGLPWIGDFLGRMLPPNWAFLDKLIVPAIETIQIAVWGTLLAVLLAIPVCFFAARNLTPNMLVYQFTRQLFNVTRGVNEIILALVFVAAVGLGPFPGVLALAVHGAGMLGKFFSESIEEIDQGPIEALRSTGAGPIQTIIFAVLPQVVTAWIAVILYRFETNLRQATVLGMVGAGGIGFELVGSMKLFQYQDTATCIVVIIAMVMVADTISTRLRAWIQKGAR